MNEGGKANGSGRIRGYAAMKARGSIYAYPGANGTAYLCRWWEDGQRRAHAVQGTRKDAQKWLTAHLADMDAGKLSTKPTSITVATFLERWMKEVRVGKSAGAVHNYSQSAMHWTRLLGHIKLQALTSLDVAHGRDQLQEGTDGRRRPNREPIRGHVGESSARSADSGRHGARRDRGNVRGDVRSGRESREEGIGLAPKTVKNHLDALRAAMNYAIKIGYLSHNVVVGVDPPRQERRMVEWFTREQVERLMGALWAVDRSETNMLAVGLLLGVRTYSELGGVRIADWNAEARTLSLTQVLKERDADVNGPRRRYLEPAGGLKSTPRLVRVPLAGVPYIERQMAWLNRQFQAQGLGWNQERLLFPNVYGHPFASTSFRHTFKRLLAQAGLEGHVHMLRHSCASLLIASGAHMKVVQGVLGHKSYKLTADTYSHISEDAVSDALDRVWSQPAGERRQAR